MDSQENALEQGSVAINQPEATASEAPSVETSVEAVEAAAVETAEVAAEAVEAAAVETAEAAAEAVEPAAVETAEAAAEAVEPAAEEQPATIEETEKKQYLSKEEVLERVKEIAETEDYPAKDEVETLKSLFYRFLLAEREQAQKAYLEAGGAPDQYFAAPSEAEEQLKIQMQIIKEKRAKVFQEQEAEKAENLRRKLEIIEKIKAMATSPDEANKSFQNFKALQQEWKEIKSVPAERANEVWRNYQLYVEQYYDLLNLNREAREYDFRKNLEQKTKLCEEAEALDQETDVVSAFHKLQELHARYREIGPVAKDLRDEIWARFKAASTVINKKHQAHFERLRAQEDENLAKKTALCEKVEAISQEDNKGAADWERHTKEIIALQQEWKTVGFAPQKMNVKIFERFRAVCDDFFGRKATFFKEMKEQFAANIEKKKALVEKAQALADSTEWKKTGDKLAQLQKDWKQVGTVPKKQGNQLWNDFITACNKFYDARNAAQAGQRGEQHENLEKKRSIISQLKELAEGAVENAQEKLQQLVDEYNKVGHVPFKDKDKVYQEYHEALDKIYDNLKIQVNRRRLDNFKSNLRQVAKRGEDAVDNERSRLQRRFEQLKQEIQTYENNLGFLNIASKKGNSLVDEMNRKVQRLRDDAELVRQKIKAIDMQSKEEDKDE